MSGAGGAEVYFWRHGMSDWMVLPGDWRGTPPSSSGVWYFLLGGKTTGPVSQRAFDELMRIGFIQSGTLVWRQPMTEWRSLAAVLGAERETATNPLPDDALGFSPDPPGDERTARLMRRASFTALWILLGLTVLGILFG